MKNLAIIIILMVSVNSITQAQETHKPDIRPFSEFAPDTLAYLKANWGSGGFNGHYTGHPIKHFLEDVGLEIISVRIYLSPRSETIDMIGFSFQTPEEFEKDFKLPLTVQLDTILKPKDGEIYRKLRDGHTETYMRLYDEHMKSLIDNLIIRIAYY